jgi:MFS transporter, SP family, arabinose:H+ symporter
MRKSNFYIVTTALIVALGGFLMGFDASVISGVVKFIEPEFNLTKLQLGWSVSSLTLTATLAMLIAGPLSDRFGRRTVLKFAALRYALSAIGSAAAPTFFALVAARMIGGLGVGASLIIAPMYIAEISPPKMRGRMVSFNQLNIVLGISVAFFTNYLILQLGKSDLSWAASLKIDEWNWRWMLGLELLPAAMYFIGLFLVPRSPRWLIMRESYDEAQSVMNRTVGPERAKSQIEVIKSTLKSAEEKKKVSVKELFAKSMKLVLLIGVVIAVLQQITGINSVFFYAPVIFEQTGIGTDASFVQAIFVGLTNLVFTIVAILLIDKLGRKPLLIFGTIGIALAMLVLAYSFNAATYTLTKETVNDLSEQVDKVALQPITGVTYETDLEFKEAVHEALGEDSVKFESELITASINMNALLVLIGIIGFVAAFAVSLGPVMWVLFSELFPNRLRGLAISLVGLVNSGVSFSVQLVFPWELANFGSSVTFLIYGIFAVLGLVFIVFKVPETKGKSLEEIEEALVK